VARHTVLTFDSSITDKTDPFFLISGVVSIAMGTEVMRGVVEEVEVVGGTIGCDMGDTIVAGTP
jgi:hypothetical protein